MLAWIHSSLLRPSKNKWLQMMDGKKLKPSSRKLHGGAVDDGIVARLKKGFSRHIKPNNKRQTKINQWGDMWPSWVTVSFFSIPWRNVILDWKPPASLVAGSLLPAFLEIHFKQSEQPETDWSNFLPRESVEAAVTLQPLQPLQPLLPLCCELFYLSADKKQTKLTEERMVRWC